MFPVSTPQGPSTPAAYLTKEKSHTLKLQQHLENRVYSSDNGMKADLQEQISCALPCSCAFCGAPADPLQPLAPHLPRSIHPEKSANDQVKVKQQAVLLPKLHFGPGQSGKDMGQVGGRPSGGGRGGGGVGKLILLHVPLLSHILALLFGLRL